MRIILFALLFCFCFSSEVSSTPRTPVNLSYIVHNTYHEPLEILTLGSPFTSLDTSPCIRIKHNNKERDLQRFFFSLSWPPGKDSFLRLKPGEKVNSTFDLSEFYDFSEDGLYVITFVPHWQFGITERSYLESYARRSFARRGIEESPEDKIHIDFSKELVSLVPIVQLAQSPSGYPTRKPSQGVEEPVGRAILEPVELTLAIQKGEVEIVSFKQVADEVHDFFRQHFNSSESRPSLNDL